MGEFFGNPVWFRLVLDTLIVITTGALYAIRQLIKRVKAAETRITELETRLALIEASAATNAEIGELIKKITAHIAAAPNREDITAIHSRIDQIFGVVKKMEGELGGVKNLTDTLHKAHIKN